MSETATEQNVATDDDGPRGPGTVNLRRYCSSESGRYTFSTPFVKGGWRIATEGRVLVRVPTTDPDTDDGTLRPECLDMDWSGSEVPEGLLEAWPAVGYEFGEAHFGQYDEDGDEMKEWGPIPDAVVIVGTQKLKPKYHYLVSLLPNVRFWRTVLKPAHMVYFRFDGGEGLVCGVRIEPV